MNKQNDKDLSAASPREAVGRLEPGRRRRRPSDSERSIRPRLFSGFCAAKISILLVGSRRVTAGTLAQWRDAFLAGGAESLMRSPSLASGVRHPSSENPKATASPNGSCAR
jgi:hypothetical protein